MGLFVMNAAIQKVRSERRPAMANVLDKAPEILGQKWLQMPGGVR